jgi:lauroyl/myristoyl acyltransferase
LVLSIRGAYYGTVAALERLACILARVRLAGNRSINEVYLGHLRRVFPKMAPAALKRLLRDYWRVHQRAFLGFFYSKRFDGEMLEELVTLKGRDVLDRAVSRGRGVLLLVPHFGDERMLHILLAIMGYRMHVISSRYEGAPEVVREARLSVSRQWHHVAFPDQPLGWLYEALEAGEVVQISPTAYGGPKGHWVWSFGVPVLASSTPVRLASSTGCSMVIACNRTLPGMRYEITFADFLPSSLDARGTSQLFDRYGDLAREFPEQYSWMNLVIRHRETNTIARLGQIPADETVLERAAQHSDWDPGVIQDPQSLSSMSARAGSALV